MSEDTVTIILGPTAHRLSPILTVTEQNGSWLKGKAVYDPDVSVELSFEMCGHKHLCFPSTPWTVITLFRFKQNLFEFNLGNAAKPKGELEEDVVIWLSNLKGLSIGFTPVSVMDRHISETRKSMFKAHQQRKVGHW